MEFSFRMWREIRNINDVFCSFFCLSDREIQILKLLRKKALTADELAAKLGISRPSAQRYVKHLYTLGLLKRTIVESKKYAYRTISDEALKQLIEELAERWYKSILNALKNEL